MGQRTSEAASSMVGVPFTGTLGWGGGGDVARRSRQNHYVQLSNGAEDWHFLDVVVLLSLG